MSVNTRTASHRAGFGMIAARSNLAYARRAGRPALLGETIGESFRRAVMRHGEREALVVSHQGYRATYRELWSSVDDAARAFMARGVAKGDRVGLWAPARHEWIVTQLAAARIGAMLVVVEPGSSKDELVATLDRDEVSVLVAAPEYAGIVSEARSECPRLTGSVLLEREWNAFLAGGMLVSDWELAEREAGLAFDDAIAICGGRTFSHHALLANAKRAGGELAESNHERVCVPVPLSSLFGMVAGTLASLENGACVVVPGESFDPGIVLAAVERERCSVLLAEPAMLVAELETAASGSFDLSSLRGGILGGEACPAHLLRAARTELGIDQITIICGMPGSRA